MKNKRLVNKAAVRSRKWFGVVCLVLVLAVVAAYFTILLPRRVTPILMYHSVSYTEGSSIHVTPENFNKQMKFLSDSGYSVITMEKLAEEISGGRRYLPGTVVITFDDGFEDNFTRAFPVLAKYDMPAVIFLVTGYVGADEDYLKWDQIALMQKNGITFGSHTRSNAYLPSLTDKKAIVDEVAGSRHDIYVHTGKMPDFFCYPTGGFNEQIKNAVMKAGYKAACTTNRGRDRSNRDLYELNRVKITNSDMNRPWHFRAKLSGFYNAFRRLRNSN